MNPEKLARRLRHSRLRHALNRPEKGHLVKVVKGVSPQGPALGNANRNQFHQFTGEQLFGHGAYVVEHFRGGEKIAQYECTNGITNEGLNDILDVMFDGGDQKTTWYALLIDAVTGWSALAATDTYDNINQAGNGWDEFTNYTDANNGDNATTRPEWPAGTPSAQSITNATQAVYDITASGTIKGIGVVAGETAQTKADHAPGTTPPNKLWSTAAFASNVAVQNGDQLKVTYTVNASTT